MSVTILLMDAAQAATPVLDAELATSLALTPLAFDTVTQSTVVGQHLAYWQGAIGFNQNALIPLYQMTVRAQLEDGSQVNAPVKVPASASYLPPLAQIEAIRTRVRWAKLHVSAPDA